MVIAMSSFRHLTARAWRRAWLLGAFCAVAHAHDMISFDPNAPSKYNLNGVWGQSAPSVLHGIAEAVLRSNGLEITLTMADGAAYKLLDPGQATAGVANATADVNDAEFAKDQSLLVARARTFFKVSSNGTALLPGSASVELTAARDTVFRIIFPPPDPGPLHLEMTYLGQIPAGQKDLLTVFDRTGATLASATLGADNPALEVPVPKPGAPIPGTQAGLPPWLGYGASVLMVAVVVVLLGKLRHRGPEQ